MIHLQEGERIQVKARKHWFLFARDAFGVIILALLPFIGWGLLVNQSPLTTNLILGRLSVSLTTFLISTWLLIMWAWLFTVWTEYYLDIWIVTDRRIINIEQKSLFNREISTLRVERIQDVTAEVTGIVATVLNFGDIHVQTAGEVKEFAMLGVSRPEHAKRIILENLDQATEGRGSVV
ncbi:MAG: PH domain-containing protein [Candidatus Pacebacteria bacterium]|nr:PH domain-containing protein [Candidatus Paceibacterota bacterium]